jgi:hypothetical protein
MQRFRFLGLVILVAALVGLARLGLAPATAAQDGTPAAGPAGHPLVGAWAIDIDVAVPGDTGAPSVLAAFGADGTYQQVTGDGAVGVGAWQPTGPNTAVMTFHELVPGSRGGTTTVRVAITVAADGQGFDATYTLELTGMAGAPAGQFGPGRAKGTRIAAEGPGTPVGPLSALEGGPPAGTPPATPGA